MLVLSTSRFFLYALHFGVFDLDLAVLLVGADLVVHVHVHVFLLRPGEVDILQVLLLHVSRKRPLHFLLLSAPLLDGSPRRREVFVRLQLELVSFMLVRLKFD